MKGNLTSKICRDKLTGTRARAHIYIYIYIYIYRERAMAFSLRVGIANSQILAMNEGCCGYIEERRVELLFVNE